MTRSSWATLAIIAVTAIWGSTFFIIKGALEVLAPFDYLAVRFALAATISAVIFWPKVRRLDRSQWRLGLVLGGVYGCAQLAQTTGLKHTSASISGFITGTYVILTPVLLWVLFRTRLSPAMWGSVALAATGLGVLSITGTATAVGLGEVLTLAGAALYALHIVMLDRWATRMDAVALTVVQLIGITVVCALAGAPGGYQVPAQAVAWNAILYTALIAGVGTMLLQTWAQRHISPTRTALLMTLEPVFAALFAVAFGGEHLTSRVLLGGSLIMVATVVGVRWGQPTPEGAAEVPA